MTLNLVSLILSQLIYLHHHFLLFSVLIFIVQTYCSQFSLRNLAQISDLQLGLTFSSSQAITYSHFLIILFLFSLSNIFFFLILISYVCIFILFPSNFYSRSVLHCLIFQLFLYQFFFVINKEDNLQLNLSQPHGGFFICFIK